MPDLFDMTDKTAFVTGGTKGIGRAIVDAFADRGAKLAFTGRRLEDAERVANSVNERVGRDAVIGLAADISDLNGMIAAFDGAVARLGRVDILVCNAAAVPESYQPAGTTSPEEYGRLFEWNVVNNAALINHAAVAMKARRDGVILATSSTSGTRPIYTTVPYGTSKAALNFFIRSLAGELAPYNVRVNAIAPGLTLTEGLRELEESSPEAVSAMRRRVPLRRIQEPREIAAGMVFLASEGGKAVTGQTIVMDGGEPGPGVGPGPDD